MYGCMGIYYGSGELEVLTSIVNVVHRPKEGIIQDQSALNGD